MHGKILVVLVNDADFEEPALNTFGGRAMTYYGRWTYKYEEAARQGAAGVIIVHETDPASYGWTTVQQHLDRAELRHRARRTPTSACRWKAGSSATSPSTCSATPVSISRR